jgi:hypothetical protein
MSTAPHPPLVGGFGRAFSGREAGGQDGVCTQGPRTTEPRLRCDARPPQLFESRCMNTTAYGLISTPARRGRVGRLRTSRPCPPFCFLDPSARKPLCFFVWIDRGFFVYVWVGRASAIRGCGCGWWVLSSVPVNATPAHTAALPPLLRPITVLQDHARQSLRAQRSVLTCDYRTHQTGHCTMIGALPFL